MDGDAVQSAVPDQQGRPSLGGAQIMDGDAVQGAVPDQQGSPSLRGAYIMDGMLFRAEGYHSMQLATTTLDDSITCHVILYELFLSVGYICIPLFIIIFTYKSRPNQQ